MPQQQQTKFIDATPPESGFIPMSQAPELRARQQRLNSSKRPAYIPKAVKDESDRNRLYIFNVGPKRLEGSGASYGTMAIPACLSAGSETPKGYCGKPGEYSDPLVTPGLPHEYYNKEGNTLDVQFHGDGEMEDPGWDFACQVIGGFTESNGRFTGKMLSPANSLERFGVGISRQWPPSKEELDAARAKLRKYYAAIVQAANEAHAVGQFAAFSKQDPDCFVAARYLGKTVDECRWLEFTADALPKKTKACPFCFEEIMFEARKCKHCGELLEQKK